MVPTCMRNIWYYFWALPLFNSHEIKSIMVMQQRCIIPTCRDCTPKHIHNLFSARRPCTFGAILQRVHHYNIISSWKEQNPRSFLLRRFWQCLTGKDCNRDVSQVSLLLISCCGFLFCCWLNNLNRFLGLLGGLSPVLKSGTVLYQVYFWLLFYVRVAISLLFYIKYIDSLCNFHTKSIDRFVVARLDSQKLQSAHPDLK